MADKLSSELAIDAIDEQLSRIGINLGRDECRALANSVVLALRHVDRRQLRVSRELLAEISESGESGDLSQSQFTEMIWKAMLIEVKNQLAAPENAPNRCG